MRNNILEIPCRCNKCGQWNAVYTSNMHKACFICKICGNSKKIRNDKGWNVQVGMKSNNESLTETVKRLNLEEGLKNEQN